MSLAVVLPVDAAVAGAVGVSGWVVWRKMQELKDKAVAEETAKAKQNWLTLKEGADHFAKSDFEYNQWAKRFVAIKGRPPEKDTRRMEIDCRQREIEFFAALDCYTESGKGQFCNVIGAAAHEPLWKDFFLSKFRVSAEFYWLDHQDPSVKKLFNAVCSNRATATKK